MNDKDKINHLLSDKKYLIKILKTANAVLLDEGYVTFSSQIDEIITEREKNDWEVCDD